MIEKITIKNFRSIKDGDVTFDTSLKVLIGENGTGKTNIMLALKFISECITSSPMRAIQEAGGLDQVFRITKEKDKKFNECSFSILFRIDKIQTDYFEFLISPYYACYSFAIKLDNSNLLISKESFSYGKNSNCKDTLFDISDKDLMEKKFEIERHIYDKNFLFIKKAFEQIMFSNKFKLSLGLDNKDTKREIKSQYKNKTKLEMDLMEKCLQILSRIKGFNFKPEVLRKTSDYSSPKTLEYNGENFSQVWKDLSIIIRNEEIIFPSLFANESQFGIYISSSYSKEMRKEIMNNIKDSYQYILPFLKEVKTIEEIDSTQIKLRFKEEHLKEKDIFYSVQHLSDGSLKFLALCLAISIRSYSFLHLEEIENYLHPKAIEFLFKLMRKQATERNVQFLISTHSETVLNQCDPNEVIISKRTVQEKGTKYIAPKNLQTLNKELNAGGFGLGTYWSMGGIEDE